MTTSLYHEAPSPLHGQGLFANTDLPPGTKVLEERATWRISNKLLKSDTQLLTSFRALRPKDRDSILTFSGGFDDPSSGNKALNTSTKKDAANRLREILDRNAQVEEEGVVIHKTIARVNHACLPNSELSESSDERLAYLFTTVQVKKDEELTINYHEPFAPFPARAKFLGKIYRIPSCRCRLCNLPASERQASDKRRVDILIYLNCLNQAYQSAKHARLRRELPESAFATMAGGVLVMIEKLERLVQEEGISGGPLFAIYGPAFHAAEAIQEMGAARRYARRLVEVGRLLGLGRMVSARAVLIATEEEGEVGKGSEGRGVGGEDVNMEGDGKDGVESENEEDDDDDVESDDDADDSGEDEDDSDGEDLDMADIKHKFDEIEQALSRLGMTRS
ncbi:SET domain-containing protein 5 [Recurvomyces mirabilis]|uniref:SET domain-containing protein 5 n=1 Tax=Recurvomyces mirabilis TaxID=574656 RepID=A0AAE0TU36_9PEZI|nr:SET domain-containing protein 5 [Recurvomyces mirabilis]KAK5151619.1 hypothetical protein LTS14_009106 [Recurvomyces mirabilis]